MRTVCLSCSALILLIFAAAVQADALRFSSGPVQTTMIELYTSEGCSSCPPAEAYLNRYVSHPELWTRYIPLAFHVDYWDYLGWEDRFASAENSSRQRSYARVLKSRTVYTPAFVVNGRPARPGRIPELASADSHAVGDLQVAVQDGILTARYAALSNGPAPTQLHAAVLGMGLTTDIRAGENRGRHSRHEFVVLEHHVWRGNGETWQVRLPDTAYSRAHSGSLRATGSGGCRCPSRPGLLDARLGFAPDARTISLTGDNKVRNRFVRHTLTHQFLALPQTTRTGYRAQAIHPVILDAGAVTIAGFAIRFGPRLEAHDIGTALPCFDLQALQCSGTW